MFMEQIKTGLQKSVPKWILPYSIVVTVLHGAVLVSWLVLFNLTPELGHSDRVNLFAGYWLVPELIGTKWFTGILLLFSLSVVIIAGRLAEQGKSSLAIILLVLNLCFVLMSGWSLS